MLQFYAVVGEHKRNRDVLLVIGDDGHYYAWDLKTDSTEPVEPDEHWVLDRTVAPPSAPSERHAMSASLI